MGTGSVDSSQFRVWQSHFCTFAHFCSYQKGYRAIALFVTLFKRAIVLLHFFVALIKSATKRAIAHPSFEKSECAKKLQTSKSHFICSLKTGITNFQNVLLPNPSCWAFATSHIFALFKSAIVKLHFLLLFLKERLCDRTFCCSF